MRSSNFSAYNIYYIANVINEGYQGTTSTSGPTCQVSLYYIANGSS